MVEESGYSGDDDIRGNANANSNQSSSEESSSNNPRTHRGKRNRFFTEIPKRKRRKCIPKPNHEQFFGDMPRRRRKMRFIDSVVPSASLMIHPPTLCAMTGGQAPVSNKTTSLYYTSRWLNQYFLNQTAVTSGSATPEPVKIPEEPATYTEQQQQPKHVIPLISSCQHVLVEEAISFSPFPRVMIESDIPHRVVHTNAAYLRKYGTSSSASNIFTAPHVQNKHDLEVAVGSLFDSNSFTTSAATSTDSLIMYPVWGCIKEADGAPAHITHYLIEANNCCASPPMETITTTTRLQHKTNTENRWRKRPAHAIA